jgi:hypothetical protein
MPRFYRYILVIAAFAVLAVAMCGCDNPVSRSVTEGDEATKTDSPSMSYTKLKALYEEAKAAGEQVPGDILEWAKSDLKKIGTWDYKIVSISSESEEAILNELKRLGSQRWECFWVEPIPGGKRFYMKRATRSYLQIAGGASKFVPVPGSGE